MQISQIPETELPGTFLKELRRQQKARLPPRESCVEQRLADAQGRVHNTAGARNQPQEHLVGYTAPW